MHEKVGPSTAPGSGSSASPPENKSISWTSLRKRIILQLVVPVQNHWSNETRLLSEANYVVIFLLFFAIYFTGPVSIRHSFQTWEAPTFFYKDLFVFFFGMYCWPTLLPSCWNRMPADNLIICNSLKKYPHIVQEPFIRGWGVHVWDYCPRNLGIPIRIKLSFPQASHYRTPRFPLSVLKLPIKSHVMSLGHVT